MKGTSQKPHIESTSSRRTHAPDQVMPALPLTISSAPLPSHRPRLPTTLTPQLSLVCCIFFKARTATSRLRNQASTCALKDTPRVSCRVRSLTSGLGKTVFACAWFALLSLPPGSDRIARTVFEDRHPHPDMPDLDEDFAARVLLETHVPKPSQEAWARCLLPPTTTREPGLTSFVFQTLVLRKERGGKQPSKRPANDMRRTCEQMAGRFSQLPLAGTSHLQQAKDVHQFHFHPFYPRRIGGHSEDARANVVTKKGQLAEPGSALLGEPLAFVSESVAQEMRACHPRPRAEDVRQFPTVQWQPGDTLRCLVAKALLSTVSDDLTQHLRTKAVRPSSHSVTRWMLRHSGDADRCLLAVDLQKAFNEIDHSCFLRRIRRVAPGLTGFCDLWYSNDNFVLFHPERIPTQRGVQQSDPLRPLLVSLGLNEDHL